MPSVTVEEFTLKATTMRIRYREELRLLRARYVGKGGEMDNLLRVLRDATPADRAAMGIVANGIVRDITGT